MLGPPGSIAVAGVNSVVVGLVLIALGYLLARAVVRTTDDAVNHLGLAFGMLCALAAALMGVHMVSRGWFFSNATAVRATLLLVALLAFVIARRRRDAPLSRRILGIAAALTLAGILVWCTPVFRMLPLTATPDTQLHNGWINQLMNGHTTPGAVISGDVPNYYPWLFHALGAITTYVTPGRDPYFALGTLQVVFVTGQLLALFALGRAIWARVSAGIGAALLAGLSGGFGFVMLRAFDVITDPRADEGQEALRYGGDLLFNRSYNIAFHGIPPPFPRDAAFALLITTLLVLWLARANPSPAAWLVVGIAIGLTGLTGGEAFFIALAAALAIIMFTPSVGRVRAGALIAGSALALYSLWALPVALNYARLGGFVDITHIRTVDLPPYAILVAWGITTPLAVIGFITARRDIALRPLAIVAIVCVLGLALAAVVPALLGDAFDTLGRRHRYWPFVHLALALLGGRGFVWLWDLRPRVPRVSAVAIAVVAAVASPVAASLALPAEVKTYPIIRDALLREPQSLLNVIDQGQRNCVVAAPQSISREVSSYTGYPLVFWTGNWYGPNRARIRWTDIYDEIGEEDERKKASASLVNGWGDPERWRPLVDRYDVDIVVAPSDHANYRPFRGVPRRRAVAEQVEYAVMMVGQCDS